MSINRNFSIFFLFPDRLRTHFGGHGSSEPPSSTLQPNDGRRPEEGDKHGLGSAMFQTYFQFSACLSHPLIQEISLSLLYLRPALH